MKSFLLSFLLNLDSPLPYWLKMHGGPTSQSQGAAGFSTILPSWSTRTRSFSMKASTLAAPIRPIRDISVSTATLGAEFFSIWVDPQ